MSSKVLSSVLSLPGGALAAKNKNNIKRLDPELNVLDRSSAWAKKAAEPRASSVAHVTSAINKKFLVISLLVLNAVFIVVYLVGVNSYAASGYEIKSLQAQILQEKERGQSLQAKASEANSIISLQSGFNDMHFVAVNNPTFFENKQISSR